MGVVDRVNELVAEEGRHLGRPLRCLDWTALGEGPDEVLVVLTRSIISLDGHPPMHEVRAITRGETLRSSQIVRTWIERVP